MLNVMLKGNSDIQHCSVGVGSWIVELYIGYWIVKRPLIYRFGFRIMDRFGTFSVEFAGRPHLNKVAHECRN